MVRRVRFSPDDPADFDPRDRRDNFDDLDDLVIDLAEAPPGTARSDAAGADSPKAARGKKSRSRKTLDERSPRHLAGADWLSELDPHIERRRTAS